MCKCNTKHFIQGSISTQTHQRRSHLSIASSRWRARPTNLPHPRKHGNGTTLPLSQPSRRLRQLLQSNLAAHRCPSAEYQPPSLVSLPQLAPACRGSGGKHGSSPLPCPFKRLHNPVSSIFRPKRKSTSSASAISSLWQLQYT